MKIFEDIIEAAILLDHKNEAETPLAKKEEAQLKGLWEELKPLLDVVSIDDKENTCDGCIGEDGFFFEEIETTALCNFLNKITGAECWKCQIILEKK